MNTYPDSTYKMLAYASPYITFHFDEAVDWACEMLEYGYDTPHLLMIAAISKPTNRLETEYYLENTLKELGLKEVYDYTSVIAATWIEAKEIAGGENVRRHLSNIYTIYTLDEPQGILYDFYLLYNAWWDIDDIGVQFYWQTEDLDKNTIEQFVINYAKSWIEKYKPEIEKLILPGTNY